MFALDLFFKSSQLNHGWILSQCSLFRDPANERIVRVERYKSHVIFNVSTILVWCRIFGINGSSKPIFCPESWGVGFLGFQYYRSVPFAGATIFRLRYLFSGMYRVSSSEMQAISKENAADTLMTLLVKDQSLLANSEVVTWPKTAKTFGGRGTGIILSNPLDQCMACIRLHLVDVYGNGTVGI